MRELMLGLIGCFAAGTAQAQGLAFTDASAIYGPAPSGAPYLTVPGGTPVTVGQTVIPVVSSVPGQQYGGYIAVGDLLAASGGISQTQLSNALTGIAARIDRLNNRFSEGIALAGSFNVLPPNPGDRFAVSVGGAGYGGAGAASISASARIDENTIVYGGLARGPTQTMVKGGLGWSFR